MMKIDTSKVDGFRGDTVVLEFNHGEGHHYRLGQKLRTTTARLVEVCWGDRPSGITWRRGASGTCWKRTVVEEIAFCSAEDQYCRETGCRVALRKLNDRCRWNTCQQLASAAIQQYFTRKQEQAA